MKWRIHQHSISTVVRSQLRIHYQVNGYAGLFPVHSKILACGNHIYTRDDVEKAKARAFRCNLKLSGTYAWSLARYLVQQHLGELYAWIVDVLIALLSKVAGKWKKKWKCVWKCDDVALTFTWNVVNSQISGTVLWCYSNTLFLETSLWKKEILPSMSENTACYMSLSDLFFLIM